jgi:hypothetical protein
MDTTESRVAAANQMSGLARTFHELPDWVFEVDEVSAGVFHVRGVDHSGRSVEATGTDPDALLDDCRRSAERMQALGGKP